MDDPYRDPYFPDKQDNTMNFFRRASGFDDHKPAAKKLESGIQSSSGQDLAKTVLQGNILVHQVRDASGKFSWRLLELLTLQGVD